MRILALLLLSSVLLAEEACRIRSGRQEEENLVTQHGTALVLKGLVVTALHVLEGNTFVEARESWIRCDILWEDKENDIAVLRPRFKLEDTRAEGTGCYASVRDRPVQKLSISVLEEKDAVIRGFDHGGSGAPLYEKGKLVGMARGYVPGSKEHVRFVPAAQLKRAVEQAKDSRP